jgi:glutamine---fructose-6-phosphate transaminase (isomerizing)
MNVEGFRTDVLAEPATLDAMLASYTGHALPALEGRRVVLIGMGSSRFAALTAAAELRRRGIAAVVEYASTGAPTPPAPDVTAIGISASGRTPETVEALARHRGRSQTLAMTNHPDADLAAAGDDVLPLLAGTEEGGIACRSFQTTLALLYLLAGVPAERLRAAPRVQEEMLMSADGWLDPLLALVEGAHTVYTVAPAERISSALESALMLREAPRVPADATETGDWLHVDVYLTKHPGYRALLFPGSRFDAGLMKWAREREASVVAIGSPVDGAALRVPLDGAADPVVVSLVEVSVVELLAAEWWRRRLAGGAMP